MASFKFLLSYLIYTPLLFLVIQCFSPLANAGEIVLNNGDKLSGQFIRLEGNTIIWKSPVLGELKIKKHKIQALYSPKALKVRGKKVPCQWSSIRQEKVEFSCEDGDVHRVAIMTLDKVIPFRRFKRETLGVNGKVSVVGTQSQGNVTARDWLAHTNISMRFHDFRHVWNLQVKSRQTQSESVNGVASRNPINEQYRGSYALDWFVTDQWYLFNEIEARKDEVKNIQERYSFSSGFGYQFWESKKTALSTEAGARYTHEYFDELNNLSEDQREFASWRMATDFRYKIGRGTSVFHKNEFSQSLDEQDEWEFDSLTGVVVPLGFGVSADLSAEYDFDSTPPNNTEKDDTTFRVGLGYSW